MSPLAPYGRALSERQSHNNSPFAVQIFAGKDSYPRAKAFETGPDSENLVYSPGLSPDHYKWPVQHCYCFIRWDTGPREETVAELAKELLKSGALGCCIQPIWIDESSPLVECTGLKDGVFEYQDIRESIRFLDKNGREVE